MHIQVLLLSAWLGSALCLPQAAHVSPQVNLYIYDFCIWSTISRYFHSLILTIFKLLVKLPQAPGLSAHPNPAHTFLAGFQQVT